MNITIGKKLAGGFALVLLIAAIIGITGIVELDSILTDFNLILSNDWPAADAVMEMHITFLEKGHAHSMIMEGNIEEAREYWDHADKVFQEMFSKITSLGIASDSVLSQLEKDNTELNKAREGLIGTFLNATGSQGQKMEALATSSAMKTFDSIIEKMEPLFKRLEADIDQKVSQDLAENKKTVARARFIIFFFLFIGLICGIATSLLITRAITRPLNILVASTDAISRGDLSQNITIKSSDETGILSHRFNDMLSNLRNLLSKIQDAINQITSSGNEILSASQQQAAGAREQSAAVSETTSAAKELSQSAEQVGDNTTRVSEVAAHALAGMSKIKETMDETGKIITSLSEKSQKIGKITELIDDIADQTNLLAVNASIEAARAGEQGKGFTVVADEIRKLADSTAKSTKDITALVEIIQHEMSNAIMSMESSVSSVNEESKLAQESAERAKEISMSSNQQISGSKQIADAMANIDEAMKQIAAGAQQTQTAVKQLTELGTEMQVMTDKYKTS